ncbi:MAG: AI-2E family transporter [Chloroflexi bacterium]|nr:AI-2E family transporter [Chloroflexota bacterium]
MGRLLRWIGGLPGYLWRNSVARLVGRSSEPVVIRDRPIIQSEEPRNVAGIAFRVTLVVLGVLVTAWVLYQLRLLVIIVFLAILLAAGIYGLVRLFERWLPRIVAILVSYLLLLGAFGLALFLIFPPLVRQAVDFADDVPRLAANLRDRAIALIDGVAGDGQGEQFIDTLTSGAGDALPEIGTVLSVPLTVAGILANLVIVVFLSALMLLERDRARGYLLNFVRERDRDAVLQSAQRALHKLGAYVRGQLLVMTVIGVGSGIGLVVVGFLVRGEPLPFAVPLAALSFITAAIPLAGAFLAGGLIVLVSLTVSPIAAILMLVWVVVLQQLEGSVITPYIQGKVVNLSAVVVLLAVVAGTSLAGIVGGVIAIPVVAVIDVVIRDVVFPLRRRSEARRRGEPVEDAPAL